MTRVWVVGNTGSGKSTLAKAIAATTGAPRLELDAIRHQPGWAELPDDEFRARTAAMAATDAWVIDGNYSMLRDVILARADTVVWLDLPRPVVMRQVIARTIRRVVRRERLWNDNREPLSNLFRLKPDKSIIAWAWTSHRKYVERYQALQGELEPTHITFVRLASREEAAAYVLNLDQRGEDKRGSDERPSG